MFRFLAWLLGLSRSNSVDANSTYGGAINEGDIHSGPHGYSPNTPYVETQYGSGFDEEADWADGEH